MTQDALVFVNELVVDDESGTFVLRQVVGDDGRVAEDGRGDSAVGEGSPSSVGDGSPSRVGVGVAVGECEAVRVCSSNIGQLGVLVGLHGVETRVVQTCPAEGTGGVGKGAEHELGVRLSLGRLLLSGGG